MQSRSTLSRRDALKVLATGIGASLVASCAPKTAPAPAPETAPQAPAVQPAAKSPTTITVMYGRAELTDDQIKLFEEKHPQIRIEYLETDGTRFMAMLAAGEPPDYTRNNAVDTAFWVNKRALLDMTPYVETSTKINWGDLHPVGEMYRYGDGFYGIMKDWGASFSVWAYLPLWEEAGVELPATDKPMPLQFYREASAKLTKREGDRVLAFGWDVPWDAGHFQKALTPLGKTIFSDQFDKVIIKDNPEAVEFLRFLTDWQKEKTCVSPINPNETGAAASFCGKQSAAVNTGYWLAANCVNRNPESEEQIMMYPAWGWGDVAREYNPNAWGAGGSITRLSKAPDEAWLFNEYYTIEEPAIERAKTGWGVPTFKSLFEYMPQGTPWRKQLYDIIMQQAQSVLPPLEFGPYIQRGSMDVPFKKYNQMYLTGEIDFDSMLTNLEADVNTAIADEMGRQS